MNYVSPSKCEISQHSVQRILLHNSGSFATLSWANKRDCFRFRYEKAALITRKSRHRLPRGLSNANTAKKKVVGTRSRWRIGDSTISPNQVEGLSFQSQGSLAFHLWQSQFPAVNSQSKSTRHRRRLRIFIEHRLWAQLGQTSMYQTVCGEQHDEEWQCKQRFFKRLPRIVQCWQSQYVKVCWHIP